MSVVIIITPPPPEAINAVDSALKALPFGMNTREARVLLYAIGLQESRFQHRRQIGGPARGFWQFEKAGGVLGVLSHPASARFARIACERANIAATPAAVYPALEKDDALAALFARLLLWTDPAPLPALGQVEQAWQYYLRTWRPGKPHPHTWAACYAAAVKAARQ